MIILALIVIALGALAVWYFWPQIETEQRRLQKQAGDAVSSEVTKATAAAKDAITKAADKL